jgi:cyclophilin family peptidyl-prolyl cis-trans isomerase
LNQGAQRNPVLLTGFVLIFVLVLGAGAYGLNRVVNPPPAKSAGSIGARLPSPAAASPVAVAACPPAPSGHTAVANPPRTFPSAPAMALDSSKGYCAYINTSKGMVTIRLRPDAAPLTVNNFVFLSKQGFYDGLTWHRFVPGFVIQGGDPLGTGSGGPGYQFPDEPVKGEYALGAVAMANSGPNTNGSQFFIVIGSASGLAKSYNLFGQVTDGIDAAQKLVKDDKILWVDIETTDLPSAPAATPSPVVSPSPTPAPSPT